MNTKEIPFHTFVAASSFQNETEVVESVTDQEVEKETESKDIPTDPYWKDYNEFLVNLA